MRLSSVYRTYFSMKFRSENREHFRIANREYFRMAFSSANRNAFRSAKWYPKASTKGMIAILKVHTSSIEVPLLGWV